MFARNQGGPGSWGEVVKLVASDASGNDRFGRAVAVLEDVIFVGAAVADIAGAIDAGAVYVFERNQGGTNAWGQVAKLTASDAQASTGFGGSHRDLRQHGCHRCEREGLPRRVKRRCRHVFERDQGGAGTWVEVTSLVASSPQNSAGFGHCVAIEQDTLVIGASGDKVGTVNLAGSVYVFERDPGISNWTESARLVASSPVIGGNFGTSVTLCGDRLATGENGAFHVHPRAGAAHVFERDQGGSGTWSEVDELFSSNPSEGDGLGSSVAFAGTTILVGASHAEPRLRRWRHQGPGVRPEHGSVVWIRARDATRRATPHRPRPAHGLGSPRSASRGTTTSGAWPWTRPRTRSTPPIARATS